MTALVSSSSTYIENISSSSSGGGAHFNTIYPSLAREYGGIIYDQMGAFNLDHVLQLSDAENTKKLTRNMLTLIRIRRLHTDELFPYDAVTFTTWYSMGNTRDPVTQEDLRYIADRVYFKMQCLAYPNRELLMQYILSPSLRKEIFLNFLESYESLSDYPKSHLVPLRMSVTLDTVHAAGYAHVDVRTNEQISERFASGRETNSAMAGETVWLMRPSNSLDSSSSSSSGGATPLMRNSTVLTFSRRTPDRTIMHTRYIFINGIGWYHLPTHYITSGSIGSAKAFLSKMAETNNFVDDSSSSGSSGVTYRIPPPICVTFIDLLEYTRKRLGLSYKWLLSQHRK